MEEPNTLQQAMEAAIKAQVSPPAGDEVEKLISTGDRVLRAQQARLSTERASYEQRRLERLNFYRTEMQRLADEAEHELLLIDREWAERRSKLDTVIGKLKAMRAA
jgi:hypothetical protein